MQLSDVGMVFFQEDFLKHGEALKEKKSFSILDRIGRRTREVKEFAARTEISGAMQ